MGIKGLSSFLKKKFPDLYKEKSLSKLSGKRLGVDLTGFFYKYMPVTKKWFDSFVHMMLAFKKYDILPYFVFDGQPPLEKLKVKEKRRKNKMNLEEKLNKMNILMDRYTVDDTLSKELEEKMKLCLGVDEVKDIVELMNEKIKQTESQIINITYEDVQLFIKIVEGFGFPYINPKYGESEAICSWLCKLGKLDGVISNDSDCLCYNTKFVVYDFSPFKNKCIILKKKKLLKALEITYPQFVDFCILCGTDYNDNIKGVGPVLSLSLIKKYGSIEEIELHKEDEKKLKNADFSILNKDTVRELFKKNPTQEKDYIVKDINREEQKILLASTTKITEELSEELEEEQKEQKEDERNKDLIDESFEMPYSKSPDLVNLWNTLSRKNTAIKYEYIKSIIYPKFEEADTGDTGDTTTTTKEVN